jgi:hypothetical protein
MFSPQIDFDPDDGLDYAGGYRMSRLKLGFLRRRRMNPAGLFYGLVTGILATVLVSAAIAAGDENAMDQPPIGFFTKLTLAHGVQDVKDVFQTDRYKPEKPASTFTADVETVYMVFDLLPRENPVHIIGQLYLDKGEGRPNEKFLYDREVYLTTSQDSGFLELSQPEGGWIPGDYKVKIHLGEEVTEASQMGAVRFKIVPTT